MKLGLTMSSNFKQFAQKKLLNIALKQGNINLRICGEKYFRFGTELTDFASTNVLPCNSQKAIPDYSLLKKY